MKDDLDTYVKETLRTVWTQQAGEKVPGSDDLSLKNDAITITGAVLYADLAESTLLVERHKDFFAAEVYKNYLYCAAKLIRRLGGEITAYDGDRIMAVFIGDTPNTDAARCALNIKSAVAEILNPAIKAQYSSTSYVLKQKVGIDYSDLFVAKTGIRGNNDLVWVGPAANRAAKMAALSTSYSTYISAKTYGRLLDSSKYSDGKDMWTDLGSSALGYKIYGSNWYWSF